MHHNLTRLVVAAFEEPGWDYNTIRSPYSKFHIANGAKYCVYNNRLMPVSQSIDRFSGYWALRTAAGLFDTGERPIQVKGPDAARLLSRVCTRNCSKIPPGRGRYAMLLYPNGKILCDGVLLRLDQDTFWYVQADGGCYSWLIAHSEGLDVEISDPNSWVTQIQGPASFRILEALRDEGLPADFKYFSIADGHIGGQPVRFTRTGWTNELGFEVYTLPQRGPVDADRLWDGFMKAGRPHGMEVCALDSMDIRRIEGGILNNGSDMDDGMTPFDSGLGAFVELEATDFIGRDALLKNQGATRILGLTCKGGEPLRDGDVTVGGQKVGFVTAGAWSPYLLSGIAIVRLASAFAAGTEAQVLCRDGRMHAAVFDTLPLYDKDKRIARGLDTTIPARPSR
jgi:glycine cleavage system aminomethyltransferase T